MFPIPSRAFIAATALVAFSAWTGFVAYKATRIADNRHDAERAAEMRADIAWANAMMKAGVATGRRLQAADAKGRLNLNQIKVEIHDSEPTQLVTCPPTEGAASSAKPAASADPVFTHRFAGLWDAGWTGRGGEPLFPYRPRTEAEERAASGITAATVLNNHTDNAEACSADRRRLDAIIDRVEELEREWGRQNR